MLGAVVLGVVVGAAVVGALAPAVLEARVLEVDGAAGVVAAGSSVPLAVVLAAGSLEEAGVVLLLVGFAGCSNTGGGAAAL